MGQVAGAFLWVGANLILSAFSKKKSDSSRVADFTPTTIATQGAFIPLLIGRRRIGPVFLWAGDRQAFPVTTRVQTKGSKKKSKGTGEINYVESGWHLLCVGPAARLYKIYQDGKVIYDTEIDRETTPSGSTLTTTTGDTFRIFWGEEDQDVNTFLSHADRVGIASRWPYHCYIEWTAKNLGPSPRWGLLEYDIATESIYEATDPSFAAVSGSSRLPNSGQTATTIGFYVTTPGNYRISGECYFRSLGGRTWPDPDTYGTDWECYWESVAGEGPGWRITGPSGYDEAVFTTPSDPFYTFAADAPFGARYQDGTHINPGVADYARMRVDAPVEWTARLETGSHSIGPVGDCDPYTVTRPANIEEGDALLTATVTRLLDVSSSLLGIVGQLLFSEYPHGLGLDDTLFDLDSLATASDALDNESVSLSVYAKDGEEAQAVLAGIMIDHGVMLYRDSTTGLMTFRLVREPASVLTVPQAIVADRPPQIDVIHEEKGATRLIYEFPDVDREFRETVVSIDQDGVADRLSHHRARKLPLATVIDLDTAKVVAERRSQEEFGGGASVKQRMNRGALLLHPGDVVSVPGLNEAQRVIEVAPDARGGDVQVTMIPDAFGSPASSYSTPSGGSSSGIGTPVAVDVQFRILEVPEYLLEGGPPQIALPRVRDHDQIAFARQHISGDNVTYQDVGAEFDLQTGGTLSDEIAATDDYVIETGPEIELLGPPDDDLLDDLTSDETNWRLGRQVVVIGDEIFFLRKLVAVSGTTYRLDGLIRARYETLRATHAAGAEVYIFKFDEIATIADALLTPGATLYAKTQPHASSPISLASVTAESTTLIAKGIAPMPICDLRVTAPRLGVSGFLTGEDVTLKWSYRAVAPGTGAGMQGAGVAHTAAPPDSTFELKFYTLADVLKRTEDVSTDTDYTYLNADLVTDFGSEQSFKVVVTSIRNGYRSPTRTITVTLN